LSRPRWPRGFPHIGAFYPQEHQMHFLCRSRGLVLAVSGTHPVHRSANRRRSPMALETLETRSLMSVPGVSLAFGNLAITAPVGSHGNMAVVSIDLSNHDVMVSFNGKSEEFSASKVFSVTYVGGTGGGDTFTNNTSLVSVDFGFGQRNNFTGGTGYNYVFFFGSNNTYNELAGSINDVFEIGGSDTINKINNNGPPAA
jgi:hypothetical protein